MYSINIDFAALFSNNSTNTTKRFLARQGYANNYFTFKLSNQKAIVLGTTSKINHVNKIVWHMYLCLNFSPFPNDSDSWFLETSETAKLQTFRMAV